MRATIDHRPPWGRRHGPAVTLTMSLDEFRETVEWLELLLPDDGCTKHWRAEHDRVAPTEVDE